MRVGAVNNTHFGMAVNVTPEAKKIIYDNLSEKGAKKFSEIVKTAKKDTLVDVNIRTEEYPIKLTTHEVKLSQLIVDVGDGTKHSYRPEPTSWLIVNAIKRAVNQAHKLNEKQKVINQIEI